MNLNEFTDMKKTKVVKNALREHYEINIDFNEYGLAKTYSALNRVRGMLREYKNTKAIYESHKNSSYLKLIMLEQALTSRLSELRGVTPQFVVENEEVQKSQVILAAQDLIDTVQKMLEQVSKINVEELNAVVTGIKNEFGSDTGDNFMNMASEALNTLQTSLQTTKNSLSEALGVVTGETSTVSSDMSTELPDEDDMDLDDGNMSDLDEPDLEVPPMIGRERR